MSTTGSIVVTLRPLSMGPSWGRRIEAHSGGAKQAGRASTPWPRSAVVGHRQAAAQREILRTMRGSPRGSVVLVGYAARSDDSFSRHSTSHEDVRQRWLELVEAVVDERGVR